MERIFNCHKTKIFLLILYNSFKFRSIPPPQGGLFFFQKLKELVRIERIFLIVAKQKIFLLILYNSFNFRSIPPPQGGAYCRLVQKPACHVCEAAALAVDEVDVDEEVLTLHLVGEV